ncbi:MAG: ribosome-binding factor A [Pelagibacterales bacterium]|nr:ribosome-binding factor A [Pelagibacterales bacterium]|tara:strand:+ start:2511 stop:2855 length:345 start_codon:yes stop_codon:yes gene_type:complete
MRVLSNRTRRVGENIRSVLSEVLLSKKNSIDGLENEFITITEVQPSADLRHAKVFISCMGREEKNIVNILNQTSSFFSKLVAKQLKTKYSPKLSFFVDFSFSQAEKINDLIKTK